MFHLLTPALRAHYSCRLCGATSYRNVVARNETGAIRATSQYRCSGCTLTFQDPKEWRFAPLPVARSA
jgi:transposase-like protein